MGPITHKVLGLLRLASQRVTHAFRPKHAAAPLSHARHDARNFSTIFKARFDRILKNDKGTWREPLGFKFKKCGSERVKLRPNLFKAMATLSPTLIGTDAILKGLQEGSPASVASSNTASSVVMEDQELPPPAFSNQPMAATPVKSLLFSNTGHLFLGLRKFAGQATPQAGSSGTDSAKWSNQSSSTQPPSPSETSSATPSRDAAAFFHSLYELLGLENQKPSQPSANPSETEPSKLPKAAAPSPFERFVVDDRLVLREGDITSDQWEALSSFLENCPHIKVLRIQGVEITAREAELLGNGLRRIRHITFCDNSIGLHDGCLDRLVAILLCCGFLESTSIIRNSLTDHHIPQIATLMKRHPSLHQLSLCWNGVSDEGAVLLAKGLRKLRNQMTEIDLSYNYLGSVGRLAFRNALKRRWVKYGDTVPSLQIIVRHQSCHGSQNAFPPEGAGLHLAGAFGSALHSDPSGRLSVA